MDNLFSILKTYAQAYDVRVIVTMDENNLTIGANMKGLPYGDYAMFTMGDLPENGASLSMLFADTLDALMDKIDAERGTDNG